MQRDAKLAVVRCAAVLVGQKVLDLGVRGVRAGLACAGDSVGPLPKDVVWLEVGIAILPHTLHDGVIRSVRRDQQRGHVHRRVLSALLCGPAAHRFLARQPFQREWQHHPRDLAPRIEQVDSLLVRIYASVVA